MDTRFEGSASAFINAFARTGRLSRSEWDEVQAMIDRYRQSEGNED